MVDNFNPLAAPIPGQSLTDQPGNSPWEHPPQFTKIPEAMDFLFNELTRPDKLEQILVMLHNKVPVEVLARLMLFTGFIAGKWTPDMVQLLAKPTMQLIASLGDGAGINVVLGTKNRYENKDFEQLVAKFAIQEPQQGPALTPEVMPTAAPPMPPAGGLMSPKGVV